MFVLYNCTAARLHTCLLLLYQIRIKLDLCISTLHHLYSVTWSIVRILPQATQAALSLWMWTWFLMLAGEEDQPVAIVPSSPRCLPTLLPVYPREGPMFLSPKMDNPSIQILAKSGCWPKLREDLGACGQGNGLQLSPQSILEVPLPLNQLMKDGCRVSQSSSNKDVTVGDLFIQMDALFLVKKIRDGEAERENGCTTIQ